MNRVSEFVEAHAIKLIGVGLMGYGVFTRMHGAAEVLPISFGALITAFGLGVDRVAPPITGSDPAPSARWVDDPEADDSWSGIPDVDDDPEDWDEVER